MRSRTLALCLACASACADRAAAPASTPPSAVYVPQPEGSADDRTLPPPSASPAPVRAGSARRWEPRNPRSKPEMLQAERIFREAKQLMNEARFAEACERFEASMDADPALGSLLNLAACQEKLGNADLACHYFSHALEWAQRDGKDAREQYITEQVKRLRC